MSLLNVSDLQKYIRFTKIYQIYKNILDLQKYIRLTKIYQI